MNGLEKHLEILLLHHDCVIVPGFGGFIAHHVVAKYDEQDGMFIPPMRVLGFNPSLTSINDSLLAQSYIDTFDVSYPEALKMIEDEVSQLKSALHADGSFKLASIGELRINQEGKVEFYPNEYGIFSPSLYALPIVDITYTRLSSANRPAPQEAQLQETVEEEQMTAEPQDTDTHDSDTVSIKKTWVGYAAAVVLSLVLFFFMTDPISNSSGTLYVSQSPNEAMIHLISNANNELKGTKKTVAESSPAEKQVKKEVPSEKPVEKPAITNKPFCIVLASKVSMKNAEYFVNQLKRQGIDSVEIYRHNNITRVVYGNYDDETSAQSALRSLRNKEVFKQSWVYKKRG